MKGKPGARGRRENLLATHIGTASREARLRLKLTQADVAERIGIAMEVYGKMERGNMLPSASTLRKLCQTLGIKADALLGFPAEAAEKASVQAQPEARDELPPETRRLLRTVRTLGRSQLSIFLGVARSLAKVNNQRRQHDGTQDAAI